MYLLQWIINVIIFGFRSICFLWTKLAICFAFLSLKFRHLSLFFIVQGKKLKHLHRNSSSGNNLISSVFFYNKTDRSLELFISYLPPQGAYSTKCCLKAFILGQNTDTIYFYLRHIFPCANRTLLFCYKIGAAFYPDRKFFIILFIFYCSYPLKTETYYCKEKLYLFIVIILEILSKEFFSKL